MKKSTKILLCISAGLISLGLVLVIVGLMAGAKLHRIFDDDLWSLVFYEERSNAFSPDGYYTVSADGVNRLEIDWYAGEVLVESYEGQEIVMEESGNGTIDAKNALVFEKENGELQIRSSAGFVGVSFSERQQARKDLHIRIPSSMHLTAIDFDGGDADLRLRDISVGEVETDTVAGNVFLERATLEKLDLDSSSGDVTVEASTVQEVDMDTVEGNFTGELLSCPQKISFDAASGNVELRLPGDSQFSVRKGGLGGEFQSEFEGRYRDETYIVGNGAAQIEMDTVQGSLRLWKANVS